MQINPQHKQLISSTEFYDVYEVTQTKLEIKQDVFKAAVEQYINNNEISGIKYTLESISYSFYPAHIDIHLRYNKIFEPDETFDSDANFEAFCEDMAKKSGAIKVGVPYYYYPK